MLFLRNTNHALHHELTVQSWRAVGIIEAGLKKAREIDANLSLAAIAEGDPRNEVVGVLAARWLRLIIPDP